MELLIWLYIAYSYLYVLGLYVGGWKVIKRDLGFEYISLFCLILAPVSAPFLKGFLTTEDK